MTIEIQGFTFGLDNDGAVRWSDGWEIIWRLSSEGFFTRKNHGPSTYGHTEFIWTGKL